MTTFSDWAGPVEATTESVIAIPSRSVIVVDMTLSGEAPELGAPPSIIEGGQFIAVTKSVNSDSTPSLFMYRRDDQTLVFLASYEIPDQTLQNSDIRRPEFSPNNAFLAVPAAGNGITAPNVVIYSVTEAGVLAVADTANIGGTGGSGLDVAWVGNDRLLVAHSGTGVSPLRHLQLYSVSGSGVLTQLDDYQGSGGPGGNANAVVVDPTDSTRVLLGGGIDQNLQLLSIAEDSISKVAEVNLTFAGSPRAPDFHGIAWHPSGEFAFVHSANHLFLVSVGAASLAQLDVIGDTIADERGIVSSRLGDFAITGRRIYAHANNELTLSSTFGTSGNRVDITPGGKIIVVGRDASPRVKLFSSNGTELTSAADVPEAVTGIVFSNE